MVGFQLIFLVGPVFVVLAGVAGRAGFEMPDMDNV
jgi:hypothetical protein